MELKLTKIGNSIGMILPKEARDKMKVGTGDVLFLTETPEGYKITPYDPAFGTQMDAARIGFWVGAMSVKIRADKPPDTIAS